MGDEFLALGRQVLAAQPFSALLGTRLEAFVPGQVTMALTLQPQHTQQDGWVHGGVLGYLAENALLFAGGSALGMPVVIAEYKINHVRPAQGAELVARASAVATAGQQAVGRCDIVVIAQAQEMLVAVAQGTIIGRAAAGV
jgi:uncharacterized protein (TIGR00369 family)